MGFALGRKNVLCGLAAAVSALLLWAAYPPHSEVFAILVALVPILAAVRLTSPLRGAATCFVFGLAYWGLSLSWMPAIIKNNGPWPLVVLGWFALSAACAAYFALFGYIASLVWSVGRRRHGMPSLLCIFAEAILWAGCEWLRATLFTGFAWNFLGTAFASMPSFAAPARLGGVYLVSALAVLMNGVFATLMIRIAAPLFGGGTAMGGGASRVRNRLAQMGETGLPLLAVLVCQCMGGRIVAESAQPTPDSIGVRIALVQRNAPCVFRPGAREDPYEAFAGLVDVAAAARPDIVVFAESAMTEFGQVRSFRAQDVAREFLARSGAKALIAGGDDVVSNRTYNAAALYSADAANGAVSTQVYHKQHLVPFGEYIPFDKWLPALQRLSPIGVSLHAGEPRLFEFTASGGRKVRIAPLICYEDTDPRLAATAKRMGADMIVLITNDSWFSNSAEAEAHASQAVLRAIETGLPIVRVGNSGVSGVIRPDGTARWLADGKGRPLVDSPGVMVETVTVR